MSRFALLCLLTISMGLVPAGSTHADLIWDSQGYTNGQAITNGSVLSLLGTSATISTAVFSDSDGGTFDIDPGANTAFFSFDSGLLGNHTGFLEMSFNNQNPDPADYLEFALSFSTPITDLQFSVLGIGRGNGNQFVDAVEVFYNGINVRTDPSLFTLGSAVALDNETYMDGFEGIANPAANSANGNLNLNFGSALVNTITIRYFSSDDANNNPQSQTIGFSDLLFVAIPEPAALGFAPLLLLALGMARRRSRASQPAQPLVHCQRQE